MQKMNPKVKKLWVEALLSGDYVQGKNCLRRSYENPSYRYCCLGVLCDVKRKVSKSKVWGVDVNGQDGKLPSDFAQWASLSSYVEDKLISYNDVRNKSFKWIAAYIKRYL